MKSLILFALALVVVPMAMAQLNYTPPAAAAYLSSNGTTWSAATFGVGYGQLPYAPPPVGLYCQTSAGAPWTPCSFSGGGGGATFPATTGLVCNTSTTGSTTCTSSQVQSAIGSGVYDASGAAAAAQAASVAKLVNANFVFVGDSITAGVHASSGAQASPYTIPLSGYAAVTTGTASSSSTSLTVASGTGILVGQLVIAAGVPANTQVSSVSGTSVTLSTATTATLSGTTVSFENTDYPTLAMHLPNFLGHGQGTNVGVSGWKIADITSDYTTHVHPLSPVVTGKPGYLFVMIGVNDVSGGTSIATMKTSISAYWATAAADGWTVVPMTIFAAPFNEAQYQTMNQYNSYIRAQGTAWGRLVDGTQVLSNNYDTNFFFTDFLHPINAGNDIIARMVDHTMGTSESLLPGSALVPLTAAGAGNTFYPLSAGGQCNTSACTGNSVFGMLGMWTDTSGFNNAGIGDQGAQNSNGSHDNAWVGHGALSNLTTGTYNLGLGSEACNGVTTGLLNICIGSNANVGGFQYNQIQIGGNSTNNSANTAQIFGWNFMDTSGNTSVETLAIPLNTIATATTIAPVTGFVALTGTTAIATITPPSISQGSGNFTGCLDVIPSATVATTTAGNIQAIYTMTANTLYRVCYNGTKWFIK